MLGERSSFKAEWLRAELKEVRAIESNSPLNQWATWLHLQSQRRTDLPGMFLCFSIAVISVK